MPAADAPRQPGILCLSSSVIYGRVGNRAATAALDAQGIEPWPLPTVTLSNHPGYGDHTGSAESPQRLTALLAGLDRVGALAACRGVLSGYLGHSGLVPVAATAMRTVRAQRREAVLVVDPVLGDAGRRYLPDDMPAAIAEQLVPLADLVTPNASELAWLTGRPVTGEAGAIQAARALLTAGPRAVVVTGGEPLGDAAHAVTLLVTDAGVWRLATPRLAAESHGLGDLFSAHFLGGWLAGLAPPAALSRAVGACYTVLERSQAAGTGELALAGAAALLAEPPEVGTLTAIPG